MWNGSNHGSVASLRPNVFFNPTAGQPGTLLHCRTGSRVRRYIAVHESGGRRLVMASAGMMSVFDSSACVALGFDALPGVGDVVGVEALGSVQACTVTAVNDETGVVTCDFEFVGETRTWTAMLGEIGPVP